MRELSLEYYPESQTLLEPAESVTDFNTWHSELNDLVMNMWATMQANHGVGLAAPQVGVSKRIFVMDNQGLTYFINPQIIDYSTEEVSMEEMCLSIPGLAADVIRPKRIRVSSYGGDGQRFFKTYDGRLARIVQHEIDHLDGILFPQRVHLKKHGEWIRLRGLSPYNRQVET
jgi:peptide deformylase